MSPLGYIGRLSLEFWPVPIQLLSSEDRSPPFGLGAQIFTMGRILLFSVLLLCLASASRAGEI